MFKRLFLIVIAVSMFVSCSSSSKSKSQESLEQTDSIALQAEATPAEDAQYIVKIGDIAPDFEMELPNGEKVILSSLRGKVVMLQFTASWCGVCRKEMPHIEEQIWQRHKDNPEFLLYGVDREEPIEKINEMIKATKVTYPIGLDPDASIFGLYAEKNAGITRNVLIDRDGRIVFLTRLFKEEEFNGLVQAIDDLLAN